MIAEVAIAGVAVVASVWLVGRAYIGAETAKARVEADLKLQREAQNNEYKLERAKAEYAAMRADAAITDFAATAGQDEGFSVEKLIEGALSNPAVIEKLLSSPEVSNLLGGLAKKV